MSVCHFKQVFHRKFSYVLNCLIKTSIVFNHLCVFYLRLWESNTNQYENWCIKVNISACSCHTCKATPTPHFHPIPHPILSIPLDKETSASNFAGTDFEVWSGSRILVPALSNETWQIRGAWVWNLWSLVCPDSLQNLNGNKYTQSGNRKLPEITWKESDQKRFSLIPV